MAYKHLWTITNRLVRGRKRNIGNSREYDKPTGLFEAILSLRRTAEKRFAPFMDGKCCDISARAMTQEIRIRE